MSDTVRKLAAIMFTDIQGYTALMQQDEKRAVRVRAKHRQIFNSTTEIHSGRVLQYYGDGTLSIFDSAIAAVECAIEMQLGFQEVPSIPVRIGIHMGDIIYSEEEIIGDSVNVASRIESLAVPGSVLVSDKVYDEIKNQESVSASLLNIPSHFPFSIFVKSTSIFQAEANSSLEAYFSFKKLRSWFLVAHSAVLYNMPAAGNSRENAHIGSFIIK